MRSCAIIHPLHLELETALASHVVLTDLVVKALARSPHGWHDVVIRHEFRDIGSNFQHTPETLVTDDKEVIAGRSLPIFCCVDFLIGSIDSDTQHLHQDPASVWNFMHRGFRQIGEMDRIRLSWDDCNGFHGCSPSNRCRG